jgi:hypothetical protein
MLGLMKESDELIPIHNDPEVQVANAHRTAARQELERLEAEEKRMIRLVTGRAADVFSDEELADARQRLDVHKGTQTGWYFPQAENARQEVKRAETAHQAAVAPAKERLTQAATNRIAELTKRLATALQPVHQLALEIEAVRQEMSDGGARPCEHPASALLPGAMVDFQLRNARTRGWI